MAPSGSGFLLGPNGSLLEPCRGDHSQKRPGIQSACESRAGVILGRRIPPPNSLKGRSSAIPRTKGDSRFLEKVTSLPCFRIRAVVGTLLFSCVFVGSTVPSGLDIGGVGKPRVKSKPRLRLGSTPPQAGSRDPPLRGSGDSKQNESSTAPSRSGLLLGPSGSLPGLCRGDHSQKRPGIQPAYESRAGVILGRPAPFRARGIRSGARAARHPREADHFSAQAAPSPSPVRAATPKSSPA